MRLRQLVTHNLATIVSYVKTVDSCSFTTLADWGVEYADLHASKGKAMTLWMRIFRILTPAWAFNAMYPEVILKEKRDKGLAHLQRLNEAAVQLDNIRRRIQTHIPRSPAAWNMEEHFDNIEKLFAERKQAWIRELMRIEIQLSMRNDMRILLEHIDPQLSEEGLKLVESSFEKILEQYDTEMNDLDAETTAKPAATPVRPVDN